MIYLVRGLLAARVIHLVRRLLVMRMIYLVGRLLAMVTLPYFTCGVAALHPSRPVRQA